MAAAALLVAGAVVGAVVGAAAGAGATARSTTTTTPTTGPAPLLDVTVAGGFTTPQLAFATLPQFYVTSDRRLITQGPQILIYPPPALPNLLSRRLSSSAQTRLLATARTAGLTKKAPDYGRPGVADVGTTTITLRTGGKTYVHAIYALGFGDAKGGLGLTPAQVAARARVQTFLRLLSDPVKGFGARHVGAETAYTPAWFRVRATPVPPADASSEPTTPDDLVPAPARDWPVASVALATASACAAVPATPALLAALRQVSQIQQWRQGGVVYDATLRAVLPGEPVCPRA